MGFRKPPERQEPSPTAEALPAVVERAAPPMKADELLENVRLIQEIMKKVMKEGEHYGIIPGCKRPSLLQPGAEKLCLTFRLRPEYKIERRDIEGGHREYEITCTLFDVITGNKMGEGVGICSTLESKYKYRTQNTKRIVPSRYWDTRDSSLLGGPQFSPKMVWNKDKKKQEWIIHEKIENDNPADCYNTAKKMSKKRAHVDATKSTTGASDIFTQDAEDLPQAKEPAPMQRPPADAPAPPPPKSAGPPPEGGGFYNGPRRGAAPPPDPQDPTSWEGSAPPPPQESPHAPEDAPGEGSEGIAYTLAVSGNTYDYRGKLYKMGLRFIEGEKKYKKKGLTKEALMKLSDKVLSLNDINEPETTVYHTHDLELEMINQQTGRVEMSTAIG
jgi:hypothetical protein